jgi:hypothetical protein
MATRIVNQLTFSEHETSKIAANEHIQARK